MELGEIEVHRGHGEECDAASEGLVNTDPKDPEM